MKSFNRNDLNNLLPKEKASSLFAALRRYNLGKEQMTISKGGNRYVANLTSIRGMISFDVNECIEHYQHRIKEFSSNPYRAPNQKILNHWKDSITYLKLIKEHK